MTTKFKPGDIVKVTKVYPESVWYNGNSYDKIKDCIFKLINIKYNKTNKSYNIEANIIEGPIKDILPNNKINIVYCKIKTYDPTLS